MQSDDTSFSTLLNKVLYYDYKEIRTDIEKHQKKEGNPIKIDNHIVFSNLPKGSNVRVYSLEGMMLGSYKIDNSGNVDVDLTSLPKGIYIEEPCNINKDNK